MTFFLHLWSIRNVPCSHCFGRYISSSLSNHFKSAYPHGNVISQHKQVVLFLQVSFSPMLHLGFISFAAWAWLWAQSSFILGLFMACFICP
jgi:hypothetical protein